MTFVQFADFLPPAAEERTACDLPLENLFQIHLHSGSAGDRRGDGASAFRSARPLTERRRVSAAPTCV